MSSILSVREKKIITEIIKSNYGITTTEIADRLDVSKRTILRTMPNVYKWFEQRNISLDKSTNQGIVLNATTDDLLQMKKDLELEDVLNYYNKKERLLFIVTELLESKDPLNLAYFASVLCVSEATISHDLIELDEVFVTYNLTIYRKQGYGIEIQGSEKNKRKALIDTIYEALDGEQIKTAVSNHIGINKSKVHDVRSKLLDMIDKETIQLIETGIAKSEKEMGFKFAESSFTALAVHLALAIQRLKNNEMIEMASDILEDIKLYNEFVIAKKLCGNLEKSLNIQIPDEEVGYVTIHLKGARYKNNIYETNVIKFKEILISNYELASMINQMIKIAEEETGYQLKQVDSLLIGLVDHLRPAINRLELDLNIRNPLLDKIKTEYPEIFDVSKKCANVITRNLGVQLPESEIGYIAMHIGSAIELLENKKTRGEVKAKVIVTCTSGIGSSKMLAERIKKEFKNINIRQVFSATDVKNEWLVRHKIDFIISTVPFENSLLPVITVNPLLLKNDIKKLSNFMKTMTKNRPIIELDNILTLDKVNEYKEYSTGILEVLQNMKIKEYLELNSYEELLKYIATSFDDNQSGLIEDILQREKIGSIIFEQEELMFLHARSESVEELSVGFYRLTNKIQHEDKTVDTVIALFAPKVISPLKLEVISEISATLINDEDFINHIKYDHIEDLYQRIELLLLSFFENKLK